MVLGATFCALVFAATWISVPTGVGNVNLGDSMLLLGAWMLGGPWAVFAAGVGSVLTDLMGGYAVYAPGTFVIKSLMCTVAVLIVGKPSRVRGSLRLTRIVSAVCAEIVMVVGYFAYEALILGLGLAAAANLPFNAVQGCLGILVASLVYELVVKAGIEP